MPSALLRRSALVVAGALFAACAGEPPLALPTPPDEVPEASFDAISLASSVDAQGILPRLEAPLGASRVGVLVRLSAADAPLPRLEARGVSDGAAPGAWAPLEVRWREGDQAVLALDLARLAYSVELRVAPEERDAITLLTWSAVVPPPRPRALDVGARREALRADIAALGVTAREDWGARATACTDADASKYRIAIHHTVTNGMGDPAANLRGIQAFHMDGRGWCDVGYHFLVSLDGRIWEGRPVQLLGAHVGGHNTGNIGVSFMGCFHTTDCASLPPQVPPEPMVDGGATFVAGIAGLYGIAIDANSVKGHRDHDGAATACPGDHLWARLDDLRGGSAAGTWAASYVNQTFPLASQPFELAPNQVSMGHLEMRNDGTETWRPGEVFLGTTEPRDGASMIAGPDWVSPSRAASIDTEVAPGGTGRFVFSVRAPRTPGDYPQYFNLVRDGVAWFSVPADAVIQLRVTTLDVPAIEDDAGVPTDDAGMAVDASLAAPDAGAASLDAGPGGELSSGCGCRVQGGGGSRGAIVLLAALVMVGARRRRRR